MVEIFFKEKYSDSGLFQFGEEKDPRKKKYLDYYVFKAECIFSPYINNLTSIPYAGVEEFEILRRYSDDDQPEEMYKRYVKQFHKDKDVKRIGTHIDLIEAEKKSYYNVSWEVVSTAKKIKDTLIGLFESKEFKISADPIDLHSKTLVEDAEMELWTLAENQEFFKAYNALAGLKDNQPDFVPESQDEMDVYKETGGFKPAYAKAMEKAIKYTRDISNWPEIKKQMGADKLTTGWEVCQDYYDPEDCMVKTRYVDPAAFVIQYSIHPDHHDSDYAGTLYTMNISEVRQWRPNEEESWYRNLAFAYCGYSTNPSTQQFLATYDAPGRNGGYGYDFMKVLIFDCEWIDIDTKTEIIFKNKWDKEVSKEVEYGTDPKDFMPNVKLENKVERFTDKRRRFGCKWIVGTAEMLEWGPSYDVTRPSKRDVSLTFHAYRHPGKKPLFKRLKPLLDNFMILWLKYQNAIAYMQNAGGLVNATAIMSVAKTKEEQAAWMRQFLESGWGFFAETNAMQMKNTSMMPIYPSPGGAGKMFDDIQRAYLFTAKLIEDMTGYNPISMGATPNPNAPVATSEASLAAMSNTLRPYFSGHSTLQKAWAESITRWIQLAIRYNQYARKAYTQALGDFDVELLRVAESDGVQYGIILQPLPDDLQKKEVYEQIKVALQPSATDGTTKLTTADALVLTGMLQGESPLKNIAFELSMRMKRTARENEAAKKRMIDYQSQKNQEDSKVSAQNTQAVNDADHKNKMEQIGATNQGLIGKTALGESVKKEKDLGVATIKSDAQKEIAAHKQTEKAAV